MFDSVPDWRLPCLIMSFQSISFFRDFSIMIHLISHAIGSVFNSRFKCSSPLRQLRVISFTLLLPIWSRIKQWVPVALYALESLTSWINFRSDVSCLVMTDGRRYILSWPLVFLKEANFRVKGDWSWIGRCTRTFQITCFSQMADWEVLDG